jgi:hypothetical protein
MIMIKQLTNTFLLFLLFFACTPTPKEYNISQEARDFICYKPGSYWIYKNDSTNTLDSVFVTSYEEHTEKYEADKKIKSISQIINIEFANSDNQIKIIEKIDPSRSMYSETNNNLNQGFNNSLISLYHGNFQWDRYSKIDFTVNNKTFNNVIYESVISNYYYQTDSNISHVNLNNEFWIAKNIFIIKKILHYNNATQSWSLIRSHIVQ